MSFSNKPKVIVIGMGSIGIDVARMAIESLTTSEVILIDSIKDFKEKSGITLDDTYVEDILPEEKKEMQKRILLIKAYEPLNDAVYLDEPRHPAPPPKGRKGKKRY